MSSSNPGEKKHVSIYTKNLQFNQYVNTPLICNRYGLIIPSKSNKGIKSFLSNTTSREPIKKKSTVFGDDSSSSSGEDERLERGDEDEEEEVESAKALDWRSRTVATVTTKSYQVNQLL